MTPEAKTRPPDARGSLVIACGALAREIVALRSANGWTHLDVQCLPAELHNYPARIPEAVREVYFENDTFVRDCSVVAMRDGRVVGTSITIVDPEGVAYTVFTGVERSARGKGIALAMKLLILERLKERGTKLFGTTNDEANAPMRGINARLGYAIAPPTVEVEKVFET